MSTRIIYYIYLAESIAEPIASYIACPSRIYPSPDSQTTRYIASYSLAGFDSSRYKQLKRRPGSDLLTGGLRVAPAAPGKRIADGG